MATSDTTTETPRRYLAAAAQMTSKDDLDANLASTRELAAQAEAAGAKLLVLPECFPFLGERERDKLAVAETLGGATPGPIAAALTDIAREHRLWVIGGGMPERLPGEDSKDAQKLTRVFNTSLLVSPGGEVAAAYRKMHLFDVAIPGRAEFRESGSTAPGDEAVVVDTELGAIGITICYDLRFPELYRKLAVGLGAQILIVTAAFTAHTGAAHWNTLLRARAIENQCYVIAAAQVGHHNAKRDTFGHSSIYSPWGDLVCQKAEGVGLAVGEIDLDLLDKTRLEMPVHDHLRIAPA